MLQNLRVNNFALISAVDLQFSNGFIAITGETGSGKSILLNALNLILGERADFSVIGSKGNKAIVEAEFSNGKAYGDLLSKFDLDIEEHLILRREINKDGKSRAFINDSPVSLQVMKEVAPQLIQIHSQYNTLELKSKEYQLWVVDVLAGLLNHRNAFQEKFQLYKKAEREFEKRLFAIRELERISDFNRFVYDEIKQLQLEKIDYHQLEAQLNLFEQQEEIQEVLSELIFVSREHPVLESMRQIQQKLDRFSTTSDTFADLSSRLKSIFVELKELGNDAEDIQQKMDETPHESFSLAEKIDEFNRILNKHKFRSQSELLAYQEELGTQVGEVENAEEWIKATRSQLEKQLISLKEDADKLHSERQKVVVEIENRIHDLLSELKLKDTRLQIVIEKSNELNEKGCSTVAFLFSANPGIAPVPIERAASGGELSRFMLALQQLISEKRNLPTVLFDEIDTGVSGDVAEKIGLLLKKMGSTRQLIAISHLPQVVAKANSHLRVEKQVIDGQTATRVLALNSEDSVQEIARLLSGSTITDAAIETARLLVQS
ncbi:MAG: hypothetical protein RL264_1161 [Bacteroidota bacterium]|jgi:DNA repair protein RecN (Recombination protein N)